MSNHEYILKLLKFSQQENKAIIVLCLFIMLVLSVVLAVKCGKKEIPYSDGQREVIDKGKIGVDTVELYEIYNK